MKVNCPKCGSHKVAPSGRRGLSKISRYLPFLAYYRCKDCWVRFWTFKNPFQSLFSKIAAVMTVALFVMLYALSQVQQDSPPDSRPDNSRIVKKPDIRMKIKTIPKEKTSQKLDAGKSIQPVLSKSTNKNLKKSDEIPLSVQLRPADNQKKRARSSLAGEEGYIKLRGIETQDFKGELRVVLLADHSIKAYETFSLDTPSRLVIDLAGKWKNMGYSELKLNADKVKSIRVGEHLDKLRIVLDLTSQKPIPPIIKESPRGLILIIK